MKRTVFIGLCAILQLLGFFLDAAFAEAPFDKDPLFLGVQSGYLSGFTRYRISEYQGTSGFQSKLEFPIQTFVGGINVVLRPSGSPRQNYTFSLSWMTNIGSGSGKVKDSDWMSDDQDILLVGSPHPGLDIYSKSDMSLKANLLDIRADLQFHKIGNVYLGPMMGFKHQSFDYDVTNVNQTGYGPYATPSYTGYVPGLVMTYEINFDMFYIGISADLKPDGENSVTGMARIGVAPFVLAEDKDEHLLRYKTNKGSTDGQAFLAALGAEWKMSPTVLLRLNGEYMRILTDGTQNQYFYNGPYAGQGASVPDKIDSAQLSFLAALVFKLH